jgi:drug/metabolite transporter (DMT)-like permease
MDRLRLMMHSVREARFTSPAGGRGALATLGIAIVNLIANVGATTCFAISGRGENARSFLLWQLAGSAFGLGTQLSFAGLVRFSSVKLASTIGIGLAFVTAEVVSAYRIFHEPFTRIQWAGVFLVLCGLLLVAWGKQ